MLRKRHVYRYMMTVAGGVVLFAIAIGCGMKYVEAGDIYYTNVPNYVTCSAWVLDCSSSQAQERKDYFWGGVILDNNSSPTTSKTPPPGSDG